MPLLRGRSIADRERAIALLTREQRALLGFWVLYVYASDGFLELCLRQSHTISSPDFWPSLKSAAAYFGLADLGATIEELRRLHLSADPRDEDVAAVDRALAAQRPVALEAVAAAVRATPDAFATIVG